MFLNDYTCYKFPISNDGIFHVNGPAVFYLEMITFFFLKMMDEHEDEILRYFYGAGHK